MPLITLTDIDGRPLALNPSEVATVTTVTNSYRGVRATVRTRDGSLHEVQETVDEVMNAHSHGGDCSATRRGTGMTTDEKSTDELLAERGKTHGDYTEHAYVTQTIMRALMSGRTWPTLPDIIRETVHMIAHKLGRVASGNPYMHDHYDDICGYCRLVTQRVVDGVGLISASGGQDTAAAQASDVPDVQTLNVDAPEVEQALADAARTARLTWPDCRGLIYRTRRFYDTLIMVRITGWHKDSEGQEVFFGARCDAPEWVMMFDPEGVAHNSAYGERKPGYDLRLDEGPVQVNGAPVDATANFAMIESAYGAQATDDCGADAAAWAAAFVRSLKVSRHYDDATDTIKLRRVQDVVMGWFANAIETAVRMHPTVEKLRRELAGVREVNEQLSNGREAVTLSPDTVQRVRDHMPDLPDTATADVLINTMHDRYKAIVETVVST